MKQTLEKLWNEYFAEKCATIEDEKERAIRKRATELREKVNALITGEQAEAVNEYVDILYENADFSSKKAFFMGCEFAISFICEAIDK